MINMALDVNNELREVMKKANCKSGFLFLLDDQKEFVATGSLDEEDMRRCYFYLMEKILSRQKINKGFDYEGDICDG